jgi:predicted deacetylase
MKKPLTAGESELRMSPSPHAKRLIASIHDVGPRLENEVDRLSDRLENLLGGRNFALLVVPDHWGNAPIAANSGFQRKLRGWAEGGREIFVHGWFHRDDSSHAGGLARFKASRLTAGEGEFLGLDRAEALRRMIAGRKLIEDITGRPVAGFIAPAWLYGEGARAALAEAGFPLAEDHMRVWRPADGKTLARGPVITWASRSRARIASSLAFARLAWPTLAPLPVIRIAVHPGDAHVPALLASIDLTVTRFVRGREVASYADLLPHQAALCAEPERNSS